MSAQPRPDNAVPIISHQPHIGFIDYLWKLFNAKLYRFLCEVIFVWFKFQDRSFWATQKPDQVKTYSVRPGLRHHVYIPASHEKGQIHPVFFLIHGVAFIIGSPAMDEAQARSLADKHNYVVMALSYRRAPEHRFPTAIYDVAAVIAAALDDRSLPIDTNKVVVGGFSAGATLGLAVAQLPQLKHRIKALVPFQPLTDRAGEVRSPYPETMPWGGPDDMFKTQMLSEWAFPPPGQDLRDRLLSPYYATRADIPQPVCFITGSADMMCQEEYYMASKLAGRPIGDNLTQAWEQNGIKYWCAKDMPHGWTHFWVRLETKSDEWRDKQLQTRDDAWKEVAAWLEKTLDIKSNGSFK